MSRTCQAAEEKVENACVPNILVARDMIDGDGLVCGKYPSELDKVFDIPRGWSESVTVYFQRGLLDIIFYLAPRRHHIP